MGCSQIARFWISEWLHWQRVIVGQQILCTRVGPAWKQCLFVIGCLFLNYDGTYYQQTEGVAMGGPPSSIVAEICMQGTQTTALTTFSQPPKVYERHVDNVFSIIRISNLHDFFQHINSLHPKTKFTMETEGELPTPSLGHTHPEE